KIALSPFGSRKKSQTVSRIVRRDSFETRDITHCRFVICAKFLRTWFPFNRNFIRVKGFPERKIHRVQKKAARGRRSLGAPFDTRVRKLVRDWGTQKSPALIAEMITTALKIAHDEMTLADIKLITRSAKDMRSAAKIFVPFKHLRKVVVFGSARS